MANDRLKLKEPVACSEVVKGFLLLLIHVLDQAIPSRKSINISRSRKGEVVNICHGPHCSPDRPVITFETVAFLKGMYLSTIEQKVIWRGLRRSDNGNGLVHEVGIRDHPLESLDLPME